MSDTWSRNVSLIICTRNRCGSLSRTLESISRLDLAGVLTFEVIVVDNGSTDSTATVIKSFASSALPEIQYIFEPRPGLSVARNTGLKAATGDVLMFTDDDCLPTTDWVQSTLQQFHQEPLQLICGRVELANPAHLAVSIRTSLVQETAGYEAILGFVLGANMSFTRAVVDKIGMFDVRLGAGTFLHAAEDTEFAYRALIHNIPVRYEPSLVIYHDHGRTSLHELMKLNRGYSVGTGALMMRYLLRGRTDLLKPVYWETLRSFKERHTSPLGWRWPLLKLAVLDGAIKYLLLASWKSPL